MFSLDGNYIDLLIILVLIYFASEAWRHGVWVLLADFASFAGSLLISLRAYKFTASFLRSNFNLSHSVSNALGFLLTAAVTESVLGIILGHAISHLPKKIWKSKWSQILALIPALGEGTVIIAFVLTLVLGLPVRPSIKKDVSESKIGGLILKETSGVEKVLNEIFGGVIEDSLTYLTIKPGSREAVTLNAPSAELKVDTEAESQMFTLVNKARSDNGVTPLSWSPQITVVARAYAKDMWVRHYFSHYSPEEKDVGDRLNGAGMGFSFAGENLALAPTVSTAFTGLMNSPGHRANILEPRFKKVGIGAVDNGYYGIMFVQVFTD